jgi:hypothetical protein
MNKDIKKIVQFHLRSLWWIGQEYNINSKKLEAAFRKSSKKIIECSKKLWENV